MRHRLVFAALCSVAFASPVSGQVTTNPEAPASTQFDFLSPGARSLAMGGAFIGTADDATAAFVNPAGLRAISRREVSLEGRGRDFEIPVVAAGRLGGVASLVGIDRTDTLQRELQPQSASGLAFLSFVYPQPRWAIAAYRHETARFDSTVTTRGTFLGAAQRLNPAIADIELRITSYSVAGSFNITPELSVGAGLSYYDFRLGGRIDAYFARGSAAPTFVAQDLFYTDFPSGEDHDTGVNVGALWVPTSKFQLGAVYRQGPEFDVELFELFASDPGVRRFENTGVLNVPHVFGVGAAFRPWRNTTVAADVTRVEYSRLGDGYLDMFPLVGANDFAVRDATELHAGIEYVLPTRMPVALRGGYWLDPDHAFEFVGDEAVVNAQFLREAFKRRGEDQHHVTVGGGLVLGRFEVNGGADFADRATALSLSMIVRF